MVYRVRQLDKPLLKKYLLPAALAVTYSVIVTVTGNETALLFYPVTINLIMLYVFASSLFREKTVIEEIAEIRGEEMGPGAMVYLRVLNIIWCVFFGLNGAISGYTAYFRPLEDWALYNGFIAYVLIGVLILAEITFRPFYKRAMLKNEKQVK